MSAAEIIAAIVAVWVLSGAGVLAGMYTAARLICPREKQEKQREKQTENPMTEETISVSKQYANLLCYDGTKEGQLNLED